MKREVNAFDYAGDICKAMPKGILMTTKNGDFVNSMVIGWGHIGIEWGKPIFVAYVRESRFTKEMMENHGEFTVNVPMGEFNKKILGVCGSKSGRDMDKIKELNLTLVPGDTVSVPAIKELPLTLECKVLYQQDQDLSCLCEESRNRFYAPGTRDEGDFHTAYYGEITSAYIVKD